MRAARSAPEMRRTQICLSSEDYEAARRLAEERGVTMSQAIREAIRTAAAQAAEVERRRIESMMSIVGILKGADPDVSIKHDENLYGPDLSSDE